VSLEIKLIKKNLFSNFSLFYEKRLNTTIFTG